LSYIIKWYIDEAIGFVVRRWGLGILYKEFTTPETDCSDKMLGLIDEAV
jgi:hypothetical protein